jgi:hypothetical protein
VGDIGIEVREVGIIEDAMEYALHSTSAGKKLFYVRPYWNIL